MRPTLKNLSVILILAIIAIALVSYVELGRFNTQVPHADGIPLPLHTEGKLIKNAAGDIVVLRGVWTGMFADSSTGIFGLDANTWDETALNYTLYSLGMQWGVNVINTFIWGDWWLQNKNDNLGAENATNIGLQDALKRTASIAAEYGIYFQIRLYGPTRAEGRIEGLPFAPTYAWSVQDFVNFWANVADVMKAYPNVILTLFDEPTGNETTWFNAASQAIAAIRNAGFTGLICVHYGYSGDMLWVGDWVNGGHPTSNLIFSEHIYRSCGSFGWVSDYPTDLNSIRNFMNNSLGEPKGTATNYVQNTYNVPIWVSAIGTNNGATDDDEYVAFRNTLEVLNEFGIGYTVFSATRTGLQATILEDPTGQVFSAPNRVGQALIDAIKGTTPKSI